MVKAKMCDRCGRSEEGQAYCPDIKVNFAGSEIPTKAHLCSDCQTQFDEWWNGGYH